MVNNLGVDPDEWFDDGKKNPLDSMPIATNRYHPDDDYAPCEYESPMQESDWFIDKPDESDKIEEEKTMHQKMYDLAVQKHSPWQGGSENFGGGSETIQK